MSCRKLLNQSVDFPVALICFARIPFRRVRNGGGNGTEKERGTGLKKLGCYRAPIRRSSSADLAR